MRELSWGIWAVRFVISMVGAAVLSFVVADYVVDANTSSANETMRALLSSVDRLNESIIANSGRVDALTGQMTIMMERSATTATEIAALRDDMGRVQNAVQDAGIQIRIGSHSSGEKIDPAVLRNFLGLQPTDSLIFEIPSPE